MAFWGAPVDMPEHASLAVQTALDMAGAMDLLNREHAARGLPAIGIGIGLNTGDMCVGDMGSDMRRSYTVVGDAVNLGSRLEGLSRLYGVDVVASESTQARAPQFVWQELDRVRVKGKAVPVTVYTPLATTAQVTTDMRDELREWNLALKAWRGQDWDACDVHLLNLQRRNEKKVLYRLYEERVASMRRLPPDSVWDGITILETK
jgi:adenylate cyclase